MKDSITSYNLRPVWKAILNVYKPVSEILSKNGISHWVAFGTAIGAARHGGFIPWDDDFDIYVPNSQMDKAIDVLSKELAEHLKVVTFINTPEFEDIYIKVQDCRKEVVRKVELESGTSRPHGIYVDIFPLDGIPDGKIAKLTLWVKSFFLFCQWNTRFNYDSRKTWRYYFCSLIALITAPFLPRISCVSDVQKIKKMWASKYSFGSTLKCGRYIGSYIGSYADKTSTCFFPETIYLDFDDIKVPIMKRYDEYLTSIYGDWRSLPPVSSRTKPTHEGLDVAPWKFGPTCKRK